MRSKFNKNWNRSKQPRKQRKFLANAPSHIKHKLLGAPLDKPLRERLKRKTIEVRKNDEVKVMRGKFTKKQGKIILVDIKNTRVQIDGITIAKKDGEKAPVWFHPSNLKIINLDDSDRRRVGKEAKAPKKEAKKEETKADKAPKADAKKETPKADVKETKADADKVGTEKTTKKVNKKDK